MKTVSITMDEVLLKDLDRGIKTNALGGRSEAIREAVRDWLKKQEMRAKVRKEIEGYRKKPVKPEEFEPLLNAQEWPV